MSLILTIDTALDTASVCMAQDGEALHSVTLENQKDQASWLHAAIQEMLRKAGYSLNQFEAVAVSIGPGSYTGLRVGLAAAKGLCYALDIPLLAVSTLEIMAWAVKEEATGLICPLIDARRMEVFTAIYDKELKEISFPAAMIVEETSFASLLKTQPILFCGNGRKKLEALISNTNAQFTDTSPDASALAQISYNHFQLKKFANLAYSEPLYLKEFYSPQRKE
ncbi:MAG: tRNA (adenosine(37)-N6)-threonylcarbamoyltransferase complex dimerization subunit type 1 TsaB [Chitinophagaceae bacterium]|nr:tRNA (adenosine(37)-N6)-threonylcarbamoyltransferase complex dimerization subunit type 1 TsaB [Chitinophagaceae bacterium]